MPNLRNGSKGGFEPGLSRLRVRHSTTELLRYMSDESVGLSGYCCERKDRVGRDGGGVACYVAATVPYDRLLDIEENEHEVMWIRMRLHKLPRRFASIVIACI